MLISMGTETLALYIFSDDQISFIGVCVASIISRQNAPI